MKTLFTRILLAVPAAIGGAALWTVGEFGGFGGTHPALLYASTITFIGLLVISLPADYLLRNLTAGQRVISLTAIGAFSGGIFLSLIAPPLQFFTPGFWCGGIATAIWSIMLNQCAVRGPSHRDRQAP